ncbi:hypothetical protein N7493_000781 [Penicillium malachiteum]|uniref:Uncharacterized protein n=1 Tax=Penicillium malachiteum TaxID=1324776 RepID=A0AAD6HY53_9EURO|nr:hypothetical protein N7493_000781 [Penicillium malachiteum]
MAPNLASSKHHLISAMIYSGDIYISQIAKAAGCNRSTIKRISFNLRMFGSVKAPASKALCNHLVERPTLYLDEMAIFLWDEFALYVTKLSISCALISNGWSKKVAKVKAQECNLNLRDEYIHFISNSCLYYLVSKFYHDQRYQILPTYIQDGIVLSWVFQGPTDALVFEGLTAILGKGL